MNQNLGSEIKATAKSISQNPDMASSPPAIAMSPSAIVDEYLDHERRKINLIVYNLAEPSGQSATERIKLDSEKLAHLFHSEFHIENIEITKCIRLGKPNQDRARPVLITIPNANVRSTILRNASSLRKTEKFENVFISPDMTVKEREEAKKLRAELQRRRSQGEQNLVIRRGKIIINTRNPPPTLNTHNPSPISTSN